MELYETYQKSKNQLYQEQEFMMGQIRDQDHLKAYMNLKNKMALKLTCHIIKFFALCSKLDRHEPMASMFIDHWGDFVSVSLFYF